MNERFERFVCIRLPVEMRGCLNCQFTSSNPAAKSWSVVGGSLNQKPPVTENGSPSDGCKGSASGCPMVPLIIKMPPLEAPPPVAITFLLAVNPAPVFQKIAEESVAVAGAHGAKLIKRRAHLTRQRPRKLPVCLAIGTNSFTGSLQPRILRLSMTRHRRC